ncbi:uracil-DNA glycosylase [Haloarchaeobius amylolyticus]|uniref:uracil-DNA glycosylase n=1 Tax=Haloarchaeobius amylolyticus TaxID=1198296 RepID=UPI00226D4D9F|nr:uracil-DNA glycosylase family protein [Haloarchaeobius amylolyticus]
MAAFPDAADRFVVEPGCARCPQLAECRQRIAWGNGPRDADVVVVGEAPAAGDPDADRWRGGNLTGLAYTSRHSGRRVRDLLASAGDPDAYYTNAVKCFPEAPEGGTNREPTAEELANCRAHLETELATVAPAVVVPTGKHATETVFAFDDRTLDGFLDAVLEPVDSPELGCAVLPILHPSYQDVWVSRLGYDPGEYEAALGDALDRLVGR